jgi:hypothetical protein
MKKFKFPRLCSAKFFHIPVKRRAMIKIIALRHWKKLNRAYKRNFELPAIKYFKSEDTLGLSNYLDMALNHDLAKFATRKDLSHVIGHELCHSILGLIALKILESVKANMAMAKRGVAYIEYLHLAKESMRRLRRLDKSGSHGFAFKAAMDILGLKAVRGMRWKIKEAQKKKK